ncbi:MAG TPA: tetratricopeptide repeat protein [Kofleriaceae bacterium]|nr:tetratricopeptide repeat protein [Kofleriaceae bacterium]
MMTRLVLALGVVAALAGSAAANDPKQAAVHAKQAKAYFDAKQYDDAIAEFRKAYELDTKPLTLFKLASVFYAKGDYKGAIEFYQKYLAADPDGPYAKQAIEFSTIANKAIADVAAQERAEADAAHAAVVEAERQRKLVAVAARIKQAEAYAHANAWSDAGAEYLAAADASGEPAHLLDAAKAFRRAPDLVKARAALLAYLDKAPASPTSEQVRGDVAAISRAIEKADADERENKRKADDSRLQLIAPPHYPTRTVSYRWQTAASDVIASGLILAAFSDGNGNDPLFYTGALIGVGATPALHGLHDNTGRAVLSVLMRVGIIGFGSVIAAGEGHTKWLDPSGFWYVAVPFVAWQITDSLLLSKQTVTIIDPSPPATAGFYVMPRTGGGTFGLAGAF